MKRTLITLATIFFCACTPTDTTDKSPVDPTECLEMGLHVANAADWHLAVGSETSAYELEIRVVRYQDCAFELLYGGKP